MQIHIARNGQAMGPFSLEEINRQLAAGTLSLSDQAWYEGAAGWAALSTVPRGERRIDSEQHAANFSCAGGRRSDDVGAAKED